MPVRLPLLAGVILTMTLLLPNPAAAAPPANDAPAAAQGFEPVTSPNGRPTEQQAIAELAEATADEGIPRCLGRGSFARTVWFRIPESPSPQELTVEATGRTLDVLDLGAFVQPEVTPPPPAPPAAPPPASGRVSQYALPIEPNACGGLGTGGSAAGEEPASAVTLWVPAWHPVMIQVGRRGTAGTPDDERAVVSLEAEALPAMAMPRGDRADGATPSARGSGLTEVPLAGATITGEDPAQPACPSLGSVWRKFVPGRSGRRLIQVSGRAESLTVFSGKRPTADNVLDCVIRERKGTLEMAVRVKRRRPVWVRIGTDRPIPGDVAELRVRDGRGVTVIDGGPGGFDPTTGGPAGGFPEACMRTIVGRARILGRRLGGAAGAYNRFRRVPVPILVRGASVCDAELRLIGPRGRVYAKGRAIRLTGRERPRLARLRTFRPGRYRLAVTAVSPVGSRVKVRSRVRGRLG